MSDNFTKLIFPDFPWNFIIIDRERIGSSQAAQTKISQRLQEVVKELSAARKEVRRLKSCQHDSLVPTKMIQTRLERRSHRPHNEACTDSPHIRSSGGGRSHLDFVTPHLLTLPFPPQNGTFM